MNLNYVRSLAFDPIAQEYDERDSVLYALSLGIGDDPLDEDELPYGYEGRGHADPRIARQAGFSWPISHGLNTFGLVCRAALKYLAPRASERIVGMSARFTAPAFPGDTIRIEFFKSERGATFRATALDRNVRVLDRGEVVLN